MSVRLKKKKRRKRDGHWSIAGNKEERTKYLCPVPHLTIMPQLAIACRVLHFYSPPPSPVKLEDGEKLGGENWGVPTKGIGIT